MKFHVFKSPKNHQWYFDLKARNGRKILQSEGYKKKSKALATVALIQRDAWEAEVVDKTANKNHE